jgi:hypothetical protein
MLYHWQGGGADRGTNEMRAEPLEKQRSRTFNSLAGAPGYRTDDLYSGSASYHPYFVLQDGKSGEGLFLGFNYLGPWSARIWDPGDYPGRSGFLVSSQLELHTEPLAPGAAFEVPNSFIGVYRGDLDSANEQLQDWQATFKWDYTREQYLWSIDLTNAHWNDPQYKQRTDLHSQVMWRAADLCRRACRWRTRTIFGLTSAAAAFGRASNGLSWLITCSSLVSSSDWGMVQLGQTGVTGEQSDFRWRRP